MRGKETAEELQVRRFFESFQYEVTRISEAEDAQTADYCVQDGPERFIVEVKSRGADVEFASQLEHGSVAGSEQPMARTNRISRRVREAVDQLSATDPKDLSTPRVIAFVAAGDDPDLQVDQFQKTIYGTVDLVSEAGSGATALPCFYFTFSDFFRFRLLDGAVVLSPRGAWLCVNTFGERRDPLRASRLYEQLSATSAVTDPDQLAERGGGLSSRHGHRPER